MVGTFVVVSDASVLVDAAEIAEVFFPVVTAVGVLMVAVLVVVIDVVFVK